MKTYPVRYDPDADTDIEEVGVWLAQQASPAVAARYVADLRIACEKIGLTPQQGRRMDDIHPGLRVIGYSDRSRICFRFDGQTVVILRFLYGGRDPSTAFRR